MLHHYMYIPSQNLGLQLWLFRTPFDTSPPELANMHDLAGLQW